MELEFVKCDAPDVQNAANQPTKIRKWNLKTIRALRVAPPGGSRRRPQLAPTDPPLKSRPEVVSTENPGEYGR